MSPPKACERILAPIDLLFVDDRSNMKLLWQQEVREVCGAGTRSRPFYEQGKTKTVLLEAGKRVFLEKGYNHAGIEAIIQAAGVPKGSFYYYFTSKEDFGLQVLDSFAEGYNENFERDLGDLTLGPLDRLRRYFDSACARIQSQECRNGCLAGNLSQEMAAQSEAFRARLEEIFDGWVDRYAVVLGEAQQLGEIPPDIDVHELAEFWLNSWQGAVLRAKTIRSVVPLQTFLNVMFGLLLHVQP